MNAEVNPTPTSTAAQALAAAGDAESARDVGALDDAALAAKKKLGAHRDGLVERLIYGPVPEPGELRGAAEFDRTAQRGQSVLQAALGCLTRGEAFTADRKITEELRRVVAASGGYGFTVPTEFGGKAATYNELAILEEELAANGLGAFAVELSGELTIGAGSLLGYGTDEQRRLFLPMVVEGRLMGFGLTEVGVGVNAKKVQAYVEPDPSGDGWRLFATGERNKLYITNARHGSLVGVVARIGSGGKKVGLFVVELPERDVSRDGTQDFGFFCRSSEVDAFTSNYNSRIEFDNFPVAKSQEIPADGVEVLFYCLRMGRCMLASMAAGYQRMFAADAAHYARVRDGVGGKVIKHELPRLALGRILGGALMSRALSHLSLEQDAAGVDLAGLRDLTKSAAARSSLESLIACERVLGGRSFDKRSRVNEARSNMHVFGVVEGEDDLILMGMVKDITGSFVDRYLAGLLGVIQSLNVGPDGQPLPREERILRITPGTFLKTPGRALSANLKLLGEKSFWGLVGWIARNAIVDLLRLPMAWVPAGWQSRYSGLPPLLRRFAKRAERCLRAQRWAYLGMNLYYQLELTRTQIPLQRFGRRIEHLVSALAVCHHAIGKSESTTEIAALQAELLLGRAGEIRILRAIPSIGRIRARLAKIGRDLERGECDLISGVEPEPFGHPWDEELQKGRQPR
ncbi:MAG: acyl-CoA/acyl-ACP dehydrogenase [Planctomycetes bacterium]|nr:acyl-CoA/acyl-ACP dehydrogenase [Planctomycetota bacterium]